MTELDLAAMIESLDRHADMLNGPISCAKTARQCIVDAVPTILSLLRQAQTDREENEQCVKAWNAMYLKLQKADPSYPGKVFADTMADAIIAQLTAARERVEQLERGLGIAITWMPLCTCRASGDCQRCKAAALLAARAPAEGGGADLTLGNRDGYRITHITPDPDRPPGGA